MQRVCLVLLTALGIAGTSVDAGAQVYPFRPITVVVPFPAGGPADTVARILTERMRMTLGQPLIIENVPGAGGNIGVARVARANPDGYTLIMGNFTSHVSGPAIYPIKHDIIQDFTPVSLLPIVPALIIGKSGLPANDMKELIAWLRENPGKATAGAVGVGGIGQLSGLHFQNSTGTRLQLIPYRGGAQVMQDLVAGQIDLRFGAEGSQSLPYLRNGQIKAFAVTSKRRWSGAPNIPTTDEAGVPGLYISFWNGIWAPMGTPSNIVAKINAAIAEALADPTVRQRFTDLGQEIPPREQQTPESLGIFHKAEIEKWWPAIKATGIKVK